MTHEIQILPSFFKAIIDGRKRFEVRYNRDRGFNAGDTVVFTEIQENIRTGSTITAKIIYVTNYNQPIDWVVFGFELEEK